MDDGRDFDRPTVLSFSHDLSSFQSGEAILDDWLRTRALKNLALGASRTLVVCAAGSQKVAGFYALSMGSLYAFNTPGSIRRNMPELIPSVLLGRLAVAQSVQGRGLGTMLLNDAIERGLLAAEHVSARLVVVHAISEKAEQFYLHSGFARMSGEGKTLTLDLVKYSKL